MAHIVSPRQYVEITEHSYHFDSLIHPGSGYAFDATNTGEIVITSPTQQASLDNARAQVAAGTMRERGHVSWTRGYWEPAVLRCGCGQRVYLEDSLTNACERCGRLYNGSGQSLAPLSQWEPEDVYAAFGPRNASEDY